MSSVAPKLPEVGSVLGGRYEIIRLLGDAREFQDANHGKTILCEARHVEFAARRLVKILAVPTGSYGNAIQELRSEAHVLQQLATTSASFMPAIDLGLEFRVGPYLVFAWHGDLLSAKLEALRSSGFDRAVQIAYQIGNALQDAHSARVTCSPMTSADILVDEDFRVKVLAFNTVASDPNPPADVRALGELLDSMLKPPNSSSQHRPDPSSAVPIALRTLLKAMLSEPPARRPQLHSVMRQLVSICPDASLALSSEAGRATMNHAASRPRWPWMLAALLTGSAIGALLLGIWYAMGSKLPNGQHVGPAAVAPVTQAQTTGLNAPLANSKVEVQALSTTPPAVSGSPAVPSVITAVTSLPVVGTSPSVTKPQQPAAQRRKSKGNEGDVEESEDTFEPSQPPSKPTVPKKSKSPIENPYGGDTSSVPDAKPTRKF